MTMIGTKSPIASLGVWSGSLVAGLGIAEMLELFNIIKEGAPPILAAALTIVGGLTGIYARVRAKYQIRK